MKSRIVRAFARWVPLASFNGSQKYWVRRYQMGGDSGSGSGGAAATYKARVLNQFVAREGVSRVVEFGCGDGRQLALAEYPEYLGVDISSEAIALCQEQFPDRVHWAFVTTDRYQGKTAELSLSLDVIFHLVEDAVYEQYLRCLFAASEKFVIIYSSNVADGAGTFRHVRHRAVSADVALRFPDFIRLETFEATLPAPVAFNRGVPTTFLVYQRRDA